MSSKPRGDNTTVNSAQRADWTPVLAHRTSNEAEFDQVVARFIACGLTARQVEETLVDGGDALYSAARSGRTDWCDDFGGALAVALLAAEVGAFAAHLSWRASGIRSLAVEGLLDEFSAVSVSQELGVSRQKVYEIAKGGLRPPYIEIVPWRTS